MHNASMATAEEEVATAKSRTGYVMTYCGCPVLWGSKLQSVIALSTTEAELVALSTALRDVIPTIEFMKELHQQKVIPNYSPPKIKCKVFEDNSGALEIATVHKMQPRTKHMNVRYHHFREFVKSGEIVVEAIRSQWQLADMLTKQPTKELFLKLRKLLMGW